MLYKIQYNNKIIELEAESSYDAQIKWLIEFQKTTRKKIKWWDLIVQSIESIEKQDFKYL